MYLLYRLRLPQGKQSLSTRQKSEADEFIHLLSSGSDTDPGFRSAVRVDEFDGTIDSVVWVTGRQRLRASKLSKLFIFDTTFDTNSSGP